ncbi:WD domain, G-beta repeat [Musa troglodytarum]|uniref:WD domain, G-beta repeat n=1 Tax=Musa troglodytarum TaxID=320322 RepID=A0A9E7G2E1_9LILI|nr:WD domain, G-beta repeat [Musa troglodytarum]
MEDMDEAMRAHFPLSFGKPSKPKPHTSGAHSATRRSTSSANPAASFSNPNPDSRPDHGARNDVFEPGRAGSSRAADESGVSVEDEDDGAMIGPPPPPPPPMAAGSEEGDDGVIIGPPRPPPSSSEQNDSDDESESSELDGDMEDLRRIPLSNEIVLKGHTKVVSALAVDHSGSRVLTGSYDYTVRMYDFQGMNSKLQSFRQLEPFEGHQVRSLSWSPTSDRFLCVTGSAQAKIYDRDGLTLGEFIKGDMYIRDLKNTKGHISGLTGGEWNPKSKETILTSSEDGSLRIWDVADFKSQKQVIKPKLARPLRIPVTACAWDHDGKRIVGGIGDGSIQLWSIKPGWGSRPDIHVGNAHSDDITGLKFSTDGQVLLSRSMDSTLKIWDLRQMRTPIKVFADLPNHYAQTNAAFSPDEQLIFTGTSVEKEGTSGGLLFFFDRRKLELVSQVGISPTYSVIRCTWHPKINQWGTRKRVEHIYCMIHL